MARPLSFSPADARTLLAYDREVFDRFVGRVRRLPGREASRRRGIGHESLFDTLVHVLNVQEVWMVYIVRGRTDEISELFSDPRRRPTDWAGFRSYARRVWSEVARTGRSFTPRSLGRRCRAPWMPGSYTVRDAVLQVTLEEAHHLGEVIGALWQDDRRPPEMTWIGVGRAGRR